MKNTNPHLTPLFGASPSTLPHHARIVLLAVTMLLLLLSVASSSFAGSATWNTSPGSGDWNTATNWNPATVPNGSADTATFASSNITGVSLSQFTQLDGVVFNAGASAFTITAPGINLIILGVGITNNSGIRQNFIISEGEVSFFGHATAGTLTSFTSSGDSGSLGGVSFNQRSTAGSATFTDRGETATAQPGLTEFNNGATAGNGTFNNNGGEVAGGIGGLVFFSNKTTAGNGTFSNNAGLVSGAGGGATSFFDDSTGGKARVEVFGNGTGDSTNGNLDIRFHNGGVTVGSIEGSGAVILAANNLTVGSNNLSTIFSGVIQDGQNFGVGGSLTKIGTGVLVLTTANTYTGGTTIDKGKLVINNRSGSGTGGGDVRVNAGTLGGTGTIAGAVTVGTGSSSGASLSPGRIGISPGTLTIQSALTFNSDGTYKVELKRNTVTANKVVASGVTISSGAQFSFVDIGTTTLTAGTVFTVIENTAGTLIAGTFSNLADGSTFTSNGNNFQVNYEGGTGNDLTLTVQ